MEMKQIKKHDCQIVVEFKKRIKIDSRIVADSALYSEKNLKLMGEIKYITRVPLTIKQAKELIETVEIEEIKILENIPFSLSIKLPHEISLRLSFQCLR